MGDEIPEWQTMWGAKVRVSAAPYNMATNPQVVVCTESRLTSN